MHGALDNDAASRREVGGGAGAFMKQIPVGRFGQPSEIANAVVFLASDEAMFTVGAELLIDGGMSL